MKLAICLSLLVGLVAVNAQRDQAPVCKNGRRTVSECDGGEFTIKIEGDDCPTEERTGKCMADSDGNMVPVKRMFQRLECFYTLPDMSRTCDPVTKTLTQSQTLVSGNVEECKETIERTVHCTENSDGELVPNRHEMKRNQHPERPEGEGPNSERPDGPQRRGRRGGRGGRGGRAGRSVSDGNRRQAPGNGGEGEGNGGEGRGKGGEGEGKGGEGRGKGGEGRGNDGERRGKDGEGKGKGGKRRGPPRRPAPRNGGEENGDE